MAKLGRPPTKFLCECGEVAVVKADGSFICRKCHMMSKGHVHKGHAWVGTKRRVNVEPYKVNVPFE